jgi:hypothetical protein
LYEGAHYFHCDCYRPQFSCMMRNVAPYFCAVCRSVVEATLAAYLPVANQAPIAQCQSVTVSASGACDAMVLPEDIDNGSFDPDGTGLQRFLNPVGPYAIGATPVEFIVTDGELMDTCETTITVEDVTPPVVTCPGNIAVTLGLGIIDSVITFSPLTSDECAGATVSATPASGSVFSEGSVQVECVATDASGNKDTCYFEVAVSLTCACPYACDFDEDGFHTALDLSSEIDVLFADGADPADPGCPVSRGDFDCDGFTTALDLSGLIDQLYASGSSPCDPCAH